MLTKNENFLVLVLMLISLVLTGVKLGQAKTQQLNHRHLVSQSMYRSNVLLLKISLTISKLAYLTSSKILLNIRRFYL